MNFNHITTICLVAALTGFTATAQATTKTNKTNPNFKMADVITKTVSNLPSEADLDKYTKKIENQRHPANAGLTPSEDLMSSKMIAFRNAFISARKGSDVNNLFKKLEADYAAFEKSAEFTDEKYNDYKYFAARVLPFRKMAGYVWRMVPAVEDGKIRASQEALLAAIRNIAEEVKIHAPNSHNEAIFRFVTEPQEGYLTRFHNESDVQAFYLESIAPEIALAIDRIDKMDLTKPIVLDERLRFGDVSFPDSNEKRFRLIGEAEKSEVLARMSRRMASVLTFTAYDFTDYLKIRRDMGKKQGIDVMFASHIGGLTREARKDIMKSYPAFGVKKSTGDVAMKNAYFYLYLEAYFLNASFSTLTHEESNDNWLLEPEVILSRSKVEAKSLKKMLELTKFALPKHATEDSTVTLNSALTGETVRVNLKAYFYNPPANLQDLMPTDFEKGPEYFTGTPACPTCKYRNYFYGRAIGWDQNAYKTLFPDLTSGKDVAHFQDVLSEARGGRVVANFFAPLVR